MGVEVAILVLREPWIYTRTLVVSAAASYTFLLFAAVCKQVLSHGVAQWIE